MKLVKIIIRGTLAHLDYHAHDATKGGTTRVNVVRFERPDFFHAVKHFYSAGLMRNLSLLRNVVAKFN